MTAALSEPLTLRDLAAGRARNASSVTLKPYWWDAAPPRETPGRTLPPRTDVVIVGSGYTGLSAAMTLLDRGRGVVVLDSFVPGFGASTRNGGQVGSGNQKFRVERLIEIRGREKATALLREGTRMLGFIERLIASEKIDCHFRRCGRFRGAMRPEHYDTMARDMEDLRRVAGVESFMVPRSEQLGEIGSEIFYGGSVLPNDASLHPGLYHAGLLERVEARGGIVAGHAGARHIERERTGFRVKTDAGPIFSREVLVATNGYTGRFAPRLRRRIVTVRSGLIATAPLPEDVMARLMPKARVYGNTNRVSITSVRRLARTASYGAAGPEDCPGCAHTVTLPGTFSPCSRISAGRPSPMLGMAGSATPMMSFPISDGWRTAYTMQPAIAEPGSPAPPISATRLRSKS